VIESARFYDLFNGLKKRLDRQPITHKHAGAFLGILKMLMAKLKVRAMEVTYVYLLTYTQANDWGALDRGFTVPPANGLNLPPILT
jgi:hypothetical protein